MQQNALFLRDTDTMHGERYHDMLEDFIIPEINQMNKDYVICMQDGAPPHYANIVQDLLNNAFPGRKVDWTPRTIRLASTQS